MGTPSTLIGPGLGAFLAFFALAVILWLLMRNMNSRMRRMAYREQQRVAELEAQESATRPPESKPAEEQSPVEPSAQEKPAEPAQDDRADPAP